jgi:hypothetical protein
VEELTRSALYQYLLTEQGKIQSALNEDSDGPNAEIRLGDRAMAQRIIEDFKLGPTNDDLTSVGRQ